MRKEIAFKRLRVFVYVLKRKNVYFNKLIKILAENILSVLFI